MADSIDLKNIGGDVYLLMSRGHHDPHEFMRHVRAAGYDWPLGMPVQTYCRTVPDRTGEYVCHYAFTDKPGRGTYPITYAREAWHEHSYEALAAATSTHQADKDKQP